MLAPAPYLCPVCAHSEVGVDAYKRRQVQHGCTTSCPLSCLALASGIACLHPLPCPYPPHTWTWCCTSYSLAPAPASLHWHPMSAACLSCAPGLSLVPSTPPLALGCTLLCLCCHLLVFPHSLTHSCLLCHLLASVLCCVGCLCTVLKPTSLIEGEERR